MTYDHKTKPEENASLIMGIIAIIVITALCYAVGSYLVQSKINLNLKIYGGRFFSQALSVIAPLIIYAVKFKSVAGKKKTEVAFAKGDDGRPFVYDGWTVMAIVTCLVTIALAFVIYLAAFGGKMVLVKVMLGVWIVQGILSALVFFVPAFKPLRKI